MRKILLISACMLYTIGMKAQDKFEIEFNRKVISSLVNNETDSVYDNKVVVKIFELGSLSSIELKFYEYNNSVFGIVSENIIPFSSLSFSPCEANYCMYKLNANVVLINLGKHEAGRRYKVYLKINGTAGNGNLIKEVEL